MHNRSKCSGLIATACGDNVVRVFKEVSGCVLSVSTISPSSSHVQAPSQDVYQLNFDLIWEEKASAHSAWLTFVPGVGRCKGHEIITCARERAWGRGQ